MAKTMGKKFMPKLFPTRKRPTSDDAMTGTSDPSAAPNDAPNASHVVVETVSPVTATGIPDKSSAAGAGQRAGSSSLPKDATKESSFSYQPRSNTVPRNEMANGGPRDHLRWVDNKDVGAITIDHSPNADVDDSYREADADQEQRSSLSSVSNATPPPRPKHVSTEKPELTRDSSSMNLDLDSAEVDLAYEDVPLLDIIELPRGGVSIETQAVGRVQFGIPPETIKDSMNLGLNVPSVYIVPVDRFCRDMGPALGVNLAEFEFPAYFNFFIQRKRCTLIVDSVDAERNIRKVFSETLLGPAQFRKEDGPLVYAEEDFAPEFPREAIPNFYRELKHFRIMPNGEELVLETLLKFCHFETAPDMNFRDNLGAPPKKKRGEGDNDRSGEEEKQPGQDHREQNGLEVKHSGNEKQGQNEKRGIRGGHGKDGNNGGHEVVTSDNGGEIKKVQKSLTYSQIRWIGESFFTDTVSLEGIKYLFL